MRTFIGSIVALLALSGCNKILCATTDACIDDTEIVPDTEDTDVPCAPVDQDGDGATVPSLCDRMGDDCDDEDPLISPTANDDPGNGIDENCDGKDAEIILPVDADGDGFPEETDCNDADAMVNPDAVEICNTVDDDCNGDADDADAQVSGQLVWYEDLDGDGFGTDAETLACFQPADTASRAGDCDDANPDFRPDADEWDCLDPADYNCDGSTGYADEDADGVPACEDCDDLNENAYPGKQEVCDAVDNDCNAIVDDPNKVTDTVTFYQDLDADSYGNPGKSVSACTAPPSYVMNADDCDDSKPATNPGATEVCGGGDEDCDGLANDADSSATGKNTYFVDADADKFGGTTTVTACTLPAGYTLTPGDCNDADGKFNPAALETDCADKNDYNCDGVTGFQDADSDGFAACEECNDGDKAINPSAMEVCDGVDNNCNGTIDGSTEATDTLLFFKDADGDGFGNGSETTKSCAVPAGFVSKAGDCDDAKAGVNPLAAEICNTVDDDCDGLKDGSDPSVTGLSSFYEDADKDTYGNLSVTKLGCTAPTGYVGNGTDCDDKSAGINPAAAEICGNGDEDCDGKANDADSSVSGQTTWYADGDGDSYRSASVTQLKCVQPSGYLPVSAATDCNDADKAVNPGAQETCNSVDDNCDGKVDVDALGAPTWYEDADKDTYGALNKSIVACSAPAGYGSDSKDCDDHAEYVHPGVAESSKTASDDNCDGTFAHTDGVTLFPLTDTPASKLSFTGANKITNTCDVTMGCGSVSAWDAYSAYLGNLTIPTGPLAFPNVLGSTRNAVYFHNTGGSASVQDECRSYDFTAVNGARYGLTAVVSNRSSTNFVVRVYRLTDYVTAGSALYADYVNGNSDVQLVESLMAGGTTEGFVLCAGGVNATNVVGFTEVWIGSATLQ